MITVNADAIYTELGTYSFGRDIHDILPRLVRQMASIISDLRLKDFNPYISKKFDHFDINAIHAESIRQNKRLEKYLDILREEDKDLKVITDPENYFKENEISNFGQVIATLKSSHSAAWMNSYSEYLMVKNVCMYLSAERSILGFILQVKPIGLSEEEQRQFDPISWFKLLVEQEIQQASKGKAQPAYALRIYEPDKDPKKQYMTMFSNGAIMANNFASMTGADTKTVPNRRTGENHIIKKTGDTTAELIIPLDLPQHDLDPGEEPKTAAEKIAVWRYENPNGTPQQCIKETGISKTKVYAEFKKTDKISGILSDKILTMLHILFTQVNGKNNKDNPNLTVSISMEECCKLLGIENTRSADHALRAEIETLKRFIKARFEFKNKNSKRFMAITLFTGISITEKMIYVSFSPEYADFLMKNNSYTQYPAQLLKLEKHEYWIFKKLCEQYMSVDNRLNNTHNIVSINTIIKADKELPDIEAAKANRHIDRDIISPIDNALEGLETAGLIKAPKQGLYVNSKKQPLTNEQSENILKWTTFKDLFIAFDIPNAPDLTLVIEKKQAKKTKKRSKK